MTGTETETGTGRAPRRPDPRPRPGSRSWARRILRVALLTGCVCVLALAIEAGSALLDAEPAAADNCQDFTDCFSTADAASDALLGLTFLGMLSMALNFVPYVGTAKGILEAIVGRDLLTGQELSMTDRLLGLIPGGRLGRGARGLDDVADLSRGRVLASADNVGDASRTTRGAGELPPPPPRGPGPPGRGGGPPEGPPPGRGGPTAPDEPPRRPPPGDAPQEWRDEWWRDTRPRRTANGEETAVPRRTPGDHSPSGNAEQPHRNAGQQMVDDLGIQNENASVLSRNGFDVHQQPRDHPSHIADPRAETTADYRIGDHYYEHKVPHTGNVRNFVDNQLEHGAGAFRTDGTQAERFVVDLSNGNITPEALRADIVARATSEQGTAVQEVIVIQNGRVFSIYP